MIPKRCAGGTCIDHSLGRHAQAWWSGTARKDGGDGRGSCEQSLGILQHPCGRPHLQRGQVLGLLACRRLATGVTCLGHGSFQPCQDRGLQPRGVIFIALWSYGQPSWTEA